MAGMKPKSVAMALLALSIVLTAWLILGSFVTYTPSVTATEIQNLYLGRIVRLGATIAALQLAAIIVVLRTR
jgi:hypothetical protein